MPGFDTLPVGLLDGHLLSDAALRRVAVGASYVVAFTSEGSGLGLTERWAALAPRIELVDGGPVADVRDAILGCAERKVLVVATGTPKDSARFVGRCLQGAAGAPEHGVPGVAVHVLRDEQRPGPVAWLTQTGLMSGYGVLFAVGFAQLHDLPVTLIEPPGGTLEPRSPHARDEAMEVVAATGVPVTTITDPSPLDRVLRDEFSVVVHPVLDAPDRHALLHREELSRSALAEGNPAAAVRLLEEFTGDVVVVLDGVRLLEGESHVAAGIAGVVLGAVAIAGVGMAVAPAAGAATLGTGQATTALANQASLPGVTVTATGQNGMAHTGTFHVVNRLNEPVTLTLQAVWTHSGNHPDLVVAGPTVTVAPGATQDVSFDAPRPTGVTGQGGYHISGPAQSWNVVMTDVHGHVLTIMHLVPGGQLPGVVQTPLVPVTSLHPQFQPPQIAIDPPEEGITTESTVTQAPTLPPQVHVATQGPTAVPTAVTTHQTPIATPTLPPTQTPPQGPTATPTVATPHQTPIATPTLPPTQTPPQGPTATPTVTPAVDTPTLTPQIPTPHVPPKEPIATPTVTPAIDTPTLTPQIPTPQTPPQGPTATPTVTPAVDTPTLTPQIPTPHVPPKEPIATPTVTPPIATPTLTPQLPPLQPQEPTVLPPTITTPQGPQVQPPIVDPPILQTTDGPQTVVDPPEVTDLTTATVHGRVVDPPGTTTDKGGTTDVTRGPEELAHTGAASTGLLAGLAAALVAVGAGLTVLGRRSPDGD